MMRLFAPAALAAAVLLAVADCASAELAPEQAAILYQIALRLTPQYQQPDAAPQIHLVSRTTLKERVCRRDKARECDTCPLESEIYAECMGNVDETMLHGLTEWQVIYLASDLDFANAIDASVLLHEMVHYIQQWNLGPVKSCEQRYALEKEARLVQVQSLREQRGDYSLSAAMILRGLDSYRCSRPERQG